LRFHRQSRHARRHWRYWAADHTRAPLTSKEDAALLKEMKVRRFISDSNGYLTRAPCSVHVAGHNWIGVAWGRLRSGSLPRGTPLAHSSTNMPQRSRRDWQIAQEPLARALCTTVAGGPCCGGEPIGVMGPMAVSWNSRRWTV